MSASDGSIEYIGEDDTMDISQPIKTPVNAGDKNMKIIQGSSFDDGSFMKDQSYEVDQENTQNQSRDQSSGSDS